MTAPLDHVAEGYDRICVPPDGEPQIVCHLWPECMCGQDCANLTDARTVRRVLILFIAATAIIATALIFRGAR